MGLVSLVGQQGERDCYFNFYYIGLLNSVQSVSRVWLFVTPWTILWSMPGFSVHHQLLEPAQTHVHQSVMPSNHLILWYPFFLLPSIFPSIRVFSMSQFFTSGGQSIGASASASLLPVNNQDWFPLGLTGLISLLSKRLSGHSSKASVLWHSAFFMVQLSHPYLTTGKTIVLTLWTFVS